MALWCPVCFCLWNHGRPPEEVGLPTGDYRVCPEQHEGPVRLIPEHEVVHTEDCRRRYRRDEVIELDPGCERCRVLELNARGTGSPLDATGSGG